jgi:hypothetical protein
MGIMGKIQINWDNFLKEYEAFLNKDEELQRRIKLFDDFELRDVFFGGRPCLPGPGPYPRASIAYDPTHWADAKGYNKCMLDGRDLIELNILNAFKCVIQLKEGKFQIVKRKAEDPCLSCRIPIKLFREMILGKHKVIWVLCDKSVQIKTSQKQLGLSDWTTILEILVCAMDLAEMNPKMWRFWENLNTGGA